MRGETVTDRTVKGCVGEGGEEEERVLQQRHCKDTKRSASGLEVGV